MKPWFQSFAFSNSTHLYRYSEGTLADLARNIRELDVSEQHHTEARRESDAARRAAHRAAESEARALASGDALEYERSELRVGLALPLPSSLLAFWLVLFISHRHTHTTLFCSQNTVQLMTAGMYI